MALERVVLRQAIQADQVTHQTLRVLLGIGFYHCRGLTIAVSGIDSAKPLLVPPDDDTRGLLITKVADNIVANGSLQEP